MNYTKSIILTLGFFLVLSCKPKRVSSSEVEAYDIGSQGEDALDVIAKRHLYKSIQSALSQFQTNRCQHLAPARDISSIEKQFAKLYFKIMGFEPDFSLGSPFFGDDNYKQTLALALLSIHNIEAALGSDTRQHSENPFYIGIVTSIYRSSGWNKSFAGAYYAASCAVLEKSFFSAGKNLKELFRLYNGNDNRLKSGIKYKDAYADGAIESFNYFKQNFSKISDGSVISPSPQINNQDEEKVSYVPLQMYDGYLSYRPEMKEQVKIMQTMLNDLGIRTKVDGYFGPSTKDAVKIFKTQFLSDLNPDSTQMSAEEIMKLSQLSKERTLYLIGDSN